MFSRTMIVFSFTLFLIFIMLFGIVRYLEITSVFFPGKVLTTTPRHAGMEFQDLYITTQDGFKINAWFIKTTYPKAPTLIFAHGNAGTMSERIMKVKFWHELGVNVLIFDYRGFGLSEGTPSEQGVYLDAEAVFDYLVTREDVDPNKIIVYGASLGGAVMIDLATHRKIAALIVESTLTSAADIAHRVYPFVPTWMMSIKFDSISKIDSIAVPKLFLHSKTDQTVPFSMGEALFNKAKDPKEFIVITGGHNEGALVTDLKVRNSIRTFLRNIPYDQK